MTNSIYRVGTANQYDNTLRNLGQRQSGLASLQENLTAGKRVLRPSDDPVAAAQAERALTRISRVQTEQRALEQQRNVIAQAESSLGEAVGVAQEMRQLMVQAGDATNTASDRLTIANQIKSLRDQLFTISERKDTNGQPLFSALGSDLSPLLGPKSAALDYEFKGLPGQMAAAQTQIPMALDGDAAFKFQYQRDGAYHASVSTTGTTSLNGRQLNTSAVQVTDLSQVTGETYTIEFSGVGPGATPDTVTAQYSINGGELVTIPDFPLNQPLSLQIPAVSTGTDPAAEPVDSPIPGLKLTVNALATKAPNGTITYSPADGDTITLAPSGGIFNTVDTAVKEITDAKDSNQTAQAVGQALSNLDKALDRIHTVRGYAGELLNRADRITGDQSQRAVQLEADRSRAEDLDMVEGISKFQNQQTGYEAALKSYSMVQKLSLFNFIA